MTLEERAVELYNGGHNCAQAVFCALSEKHGMNLEQAAKLSSGFGGGMAQLGETCGALTGLFMGLGLDQGYQATDSKETKDAYFEKVHKIGEEFKCIKGSTKCPNIIDIYKDMERPDVNGKPVKQCEHVVREAIRLYELYK